MIEQRFKASCAPNGARLGDDIRAHMDNGAGGYHISYDGDVVIEYGDWTGIDLDAVQAAIDSHDPSERVYATDVQAKPPLKKVHRFHIGATTVLVAYEVLRALGIVP